ncbi:MAG: lactonase family protein [Burkholderiales bacterium]|nr:lactonase family protein [Burkholderiales bacterium]
MTTAVYVSHAESGDIHVLHLDDGSGALTTMQRVEVGGTLMPLALGPDRHVLYAARRSEPLAVMSFAIDANSGALTLLGEAPLPHSMASIATDRSGRWLLSASYGGNLVAVSPIGADGVVQAATQVVPTGPNAHAIVSDASNRFVFATNLGAGVVLQLRFDASTGQLSPNEPASIAVRAGAGPRHLAWHPAGSWLCLLNELDASIDVFAFDAEQGTLAHRQTVSSVPPGFVGTPWAADLHFRPDGRSLYSSDRRSDTIAAFAFNASSGQLNLIGHTPVPAEPRGFNITADGRWLVAAGQAAHRVALFRIDALTGALAAAGEHAVGRGPNWIETVPLV